MIVTVIGLSDKMKELIGNPEPSSLTPSNLADILDQKSYRLKDGDDKIPPAETGVIMHVHSPAQPGPLYAPRFETFAATVEAATIMDDGQEARCFRPWDGAVLKLRVGQPRQGNLFGNHQL